jgi:hypothetical protein
MMITNPNLKKSLRAKKMMSTMKKTQMMSLKRIPLKGRTPYPKGVIK